MASASKEDCLQFPDCWNANNEKEYMKAFVDPESESTDKYNHTSSGTSHRTRWKCYVLYGLCLSILIILGVFAIYVSTHKSICHLKSLDISNETIPNITSPSSFVEEFVEKVPSQTNSLGNMLKPFEKCSPEQKTWRYRKRSGVNLRNFQATEATVPNQNEIPTIDSSRDGTWQTTTGLPDQTFSDTLIVDCPSSNLINPEENESQSESDSNIKINLAKLRRLARKSKFETPKKIWLRLSKATAKEVEFCSDYAAIGNIVYHDLFVGILIDPEWYFLLGYENLRNHGRISSKWYTLSLFPQRQIFSVKGLNFGLVITPTNCFNFASSPFSKITHRFDDILFWQEENRAYICERDDGQRECVDSNVYEKCRDYFKDNIGDYEKVKEITDIHYLKYETFFEIYSAT